VLGGIMLEFHYRVEAVMLIVKRYLVIKVKCVPVAYLVMAEGRKEPIKVRCELVEYRDMGEGKKVHIQVERRLKSHL
jgi:hypothetical protein